MATQKILCSGFCFDTTRTKRIYYASKTIFKLMLTKMTTNRNLVNNLTPTE